MSHVLSVVLPKLLGAPRPTIKPEIMKRPGYSWGEENYVSVHNFGMQEAVDCVAEITFSYRPEMGGFSCIWEETMDSFHTIYRKSETKLLLFYIDEHYITFFTSGKPKVFYSDPLDQKMDGSKLISSVHGAGSALPDSKEFILRIKGSLLTVTPTKRSKRVYVRQARWPL